MILIHVSDVTYVRYFKMIELHHRVCQCDTCILYNGVHAIQNTQTHENEVNVHLVMKDSDLAGGRTLE